MDIVKYMFMWPPFHCLSKKCWLILIRNLIYRIGQDFLDMQYIVLTVRYLPRMGFPFGSPQALAAMCPYGTGIRISSALL